jgi:hypothetical protein
MPQNRRPFEPVKIGVIGLGRFGRLHALTLSSLAEAELVAVVARRQESLDKFSAEIPDVTRLAGCGSGDRRIRGRGMGRGMFDVRACAGCEEIASGREDSAARKANL